jgi:hypothetical protein
MGITPMGSLAFSCSDYFYREISSMKQLNDLKLVIPEEHEIFLMPDVRIIGIARRCTFESDVAGLSPHEEYWNEFLAFGGVIKRLPLVIKDSMVCWTGDCPKGADYYTYMPGVVFPADTPVPDGLDYRDLPGTYVAKGVFGDQNNMNDVHRYFSQLGFVSCYTDLGWNAKLFLTEDEKRNHYNTPCRWLIPCAEGNR